MRLGQQITRYFYATCQRVVSCHVRRRGATRANSIFDFKVKDATGAEVDLSDYRDEKKAFLVVNVASK